MDRASELKITVDKVARHVAEIAPDICEVQYQMIDNLLETIMLFPIVEINDTKEEEEKES
jgi:hypothetical protein